jgi:hypothetical protein
VFGIERKIKHQEKLKIQKRILKMYRSEQQVFIIGTGRCGTTLVKKILGKHEKLHSFSKELRFISDKDGLVDLVDSLSSRWNPFNTSESVYRFHRLMLSYLWSEPIYHKIMSFFFTRLLGFSGRKYRFIDFSSEIPRKHCKKEINNFLNELVEDVDDGYWYGSESYKMKPKIITTKSKKKEILYDRAGSFVDRLLSYPLKDTPKSQWCDDTPINILNAGAISKMLPSAKFIHVFRDPRDVVASYADNDQSWAPTNPLTAACWISEIMDRWEVEKSEISSDDVLEVRYENMVKDKFSTFEKIYKFLNIESKNYINEIEMRKNSLRRHKNQMSKEEIHVLEKKLYKVMNKYSYK